MEAKKTLRADLSSKSNMFRAIGFIVSLSLVIALFEWKSYESTEFELGLTDSNLQVEEIIEIPPTAQPPPPPPQVRAPVIVAVPDIEEIEDEIEVNLDVEITEDTEVEEVIFEAPEIVEEEVEEIFTIVENQPEPPGGYSAFYKEIGEKIKYPAVAKRMGIEGKVYVQFIIDKDGSLTDFTVVKGIGSDCDEEAIRVLSQMPKWKPGKQRGRPVKVRMIIPIHFTLAK